jgi:hypothetical protein
VDPGSVAALKEVIPAVVALAFVSGPVLWYWIKKNHDLRVKEMEMESDARIHALEKRLAMAETLLAARGLPEAEKQPDRPELMEAPPLPVRQR